MINLFILRHAQTDSEMQERTLGTLDWPLNKDGIKSATNFALKLKQSSNKIDYIISSPLKRAKQTAEIIGETLDLPIHINDLVTERDFGEMNGLSWPEFVAKYPHLSKHNTPLFQPNLPRGESIPAVEERAHQFIKFLSANHDGKNILIVTHTGVIRILKRLIGGVSIQESRKNDTKNLGLTHMVLKPKKYAFFDFDNTLLDGLSTDSFYSYLANNNLIDNPHDILERHTIAYNACMAGEVSYNKTTDIMMTILANAIKGITEKDLSLLIQSFIKDSNMKLFPYAIPLLNYLSAQGYTIYILSAGIPQIINEFCKDFKFKYSVEGTILSKDKSNKFDGSVIRVLNAELKSEFIKSIPNSSYSIAFGDSDGDLPMLEAVDKGFLINPWGDEIVKKAKGICVIKSSDMDEIIALVQKSI